MTTPLGSATFARIAPVTPEQSAPMIAFTPSAVIRRSAAAVAAPASMQVESARTGVTFAPPRRAPDSLTSAMASSAPAPMSGVIDSSGPVKPRMTPILISSAWLPANATPVISAVAAVAVISLFMVVSLIVIFS